jgi:hypothetical protein
VFGVVAAVLAGGTTPVVAVLQALLVPGDLRLGLLTSWLLRRPTRTLLAGLHPVALGIGLASLLALAVAARTGGFRLLSRAARAGARALAGRVSSEAASEPVGRAGAGVGAPAASGLDHSWPTAPPPVAAASAAAARPPSGPDNAAAGCWDGSRPLPWRLRRRYDPTGAIVRVTTITGPVGRALVGGRPYTVCGTGRRLRPDARYVVLGRDGDVLIVATDAD